MIFKFYIFSSLLNALTSSFCSFIMLISKNKTKTSYSFLIFSLFVSLWSICYFIWLICPDKEFALLYSRVLNMFSLFIPPTFFHFCCHLVNKYEHHKKLIQFFYLISFIILPFTFTPLYISNVENVSVFNFWPKAGPLYILFVLDYLCLISLALIEFYLKIKSSIDLKEKIKFQYAFYGLVVGFLGGSTNIFYFYDLNIPPIGNIFVSIYEFLLMYSVFKYQFMDITLVIKRSLVYTALVTIITLFYLILIYFTEHIIQSYFGYKSLLISIGSATVIALAFTPLKNLIQNFIEKTFFKGSYTQISEENELLRQEVTQKERLKTVAILASGMAHEIKNPLTVIKTFTEYLPSKINDKEFIANFLPRVTQEVNRIDNLVHELLAYAKPASPVLKPVNIHDLITNTTDLLSNEYLKKKITTNISFNAPSSTQLMIDHNQIKQALLNILLNAIESMPYGGQLNISSSLNHQSSQFNIKIQDTGVGIDPKDIDHIFDPFFSKKDNGTGLGLSITHEIIQNHQGKIYVESVKNTGTIFIIELPTTLPS